MNLEIKVFKQQIGYYDNDKGWGRTLVGPFVSFFSRPFMTALNQLITDIKANRESEAGKKAAVVKEIKNRKENKKEENKEENKEKDESKENDIKDEKPVLPAIASTPKWDDGELTDAEMDSLKGILDSYKDEYNKSEDKKDATSASGRVYHCLLPLVNACLNSREIERNASAMVLKETATPAVPGRGSKRAS